MAVNLGEPSLLSPIAGAAWAVTDAAIKTAGAPDLALLRLPVTATVAAILTRNAFAAAPVTVARAHLVTGASRALLVNSGNANAGTGDQGVAATRACCARAAQALGLEANQVVPFSTGVIGQPLPMARLRPAIDGLAEPAQAADWLAAARAITTTDTVAKGTSRRFSLADGQTVTLTGIVKGAGMIRPNMATLLAFIATDAAIARADLDAALATANAASFDRISIDGDTSTNDACALAATGAGAALDARSPDWSAFVAAITDLARELACAVVRDGEGATRFITLNVTGATDESEARAVAFTVAHSPLVKTACFAGDPNWGRVLAAVGRAAVADLAVDRVSIAFDDVAVVTGGQPDCDYTEARGAAVVAQSEYTIGIDLGRGPGATTVWTSDLSYEYVRINAEYRS